MYFVLKYLFQPVEKMTNCIIRQLTLSVSPFQIKWNSTPKKIGTGAVICLAKERLPLTDNVWILPVNMI